MSVACLQHRKQFVRVKIMHEEVVPPNLSVSVAMSRRPIVMMSSKECDYRSCLFEKMCTGGVGVRAKWQILIRALSEFDEQFDGCAGAEYGGGGLGRRRGFRSESELAASRRRLRDHLAIPLFIRSY